MKMDERELVERLKKGDEMAFIEIVKRYKDRICLLYTSPSPRD